MRPLAETVVAGSGQSRARVGVVVAQPDLDPGGVELADQVEHLGPVGQGLVAVGEPLGHIEGPAVVSRQLDGHPTASGWGNRVGTSTIRSSMAPRIQADELDLGRRGTLQVHTPDRAPVVVVAEVALG